MPTRLKEKLGQGHRIQVLSGPGGCVGGHIPQEEEMSAPQLCTYTWDQESWEGPESSGICTRQKRDHEKSMSKARGQYTDEVSLHRRPCSGALGIHSEVTSSTCLSATAITTSSSIQIHAKVESIH